jgi:guanosine-3',5'-bis(diphosphate) 3'-pyrophosphohydrolase
MKSSDLLLTTCNNIDEDLEFILGDSVNYSNSEILKIKEAIKLYKKYHAGQFRVSGEQYYTHPFEVAKILVKLQMDPDTVITGILHDTLEDTELEVEKIAELFGKDVGTLVDGVTKLAKISFKSANVMQAQNFKKLILAISDDIRVLIVKLVDRLHNMRTLGALPEDKKSTIALETLEIYAPLAGRIGFQQIKLELEDIAFSILYSNIHISITSKLDKFIGADSTYIDEIIEALKKVLSDNGVKSELHGRKKSPYSIWMKMKQKNISFEQLCDVFAFRVIVDELMDCYKALGIIHTIYKMVPGNFQDFISLPKENNYQSIHTVIIGPSQKKIEIQIKTKQMHEVAEVGLAAHWAYKESLSMVGYEWVSDLLNIVDQDSDLDEFLYNTKLAIYYDQIFCFTPKGKRISLPRNATVLDFAYSVGIEVGNHSTGALINGLFVQNDHILNNGDQVEILTSPKQRPLLGWINFVTTAKARSSIQKFVFHNTDAENIDIGRSIMKEILNSQNIRNSKKFEADLLKNFNKVNLDLLYIDLALGKISEDEILIYIRLKNSNIKSLVQLIGYRPLKKSSKGSFFTSVKDISKYLSIIVEKCCKSNKRDKIVCFLGGGRLSIHASDCKSLNNLKDSGSESNIINNELKSLHFIVTIECNSILSEIIQIFKKDIYSILDIKMKEIGNNLFEINIKFKTFSSGDSENIVAFFKKKKGIKKISKILI